MVSKRLVRSAAVGAGAVVLGNRLLRCPAAELAPPLARPQQTYQWRQCEVAYTEAGDPETPDIVLLHAPAAGRTSHEFRYVVDALSETYHVVAPDLPGFGRSEGPPGAYDGDEYVAFLRSFLADLTERPTVIAASLSGAYAVAAGSSNEGGDEATTENAIDVDEYVLVCPTAGAHRPSRTFGTAVSAPVLGEALRNVVASKPLLRYRFATAGFAEPAAMTDEWLQYSWRAAHRPDGHRLFAARADGQLDLDIDLGTSLSEGDVPATLVWGRAADRPPVAAGRRLARAADARLVVFENAATFPHAEHPEPFVELVTA